MLFQRLIYMMKYLKEFYIISNILIKHYKTSWTKLIQILIFFKFSIKTLYLSIFLWMIWHGYSIMNSVSFQ